MYKITDPELRPTDETFTHIDEVDGTVRHFAVGAIQRWLETVKFIPPIWIEIESTFVNFIQKKRGIEEPRLKRLENSLYRDVPIIMADMPDDSVLIIDGHHRYVRRWLDGETTIEGYRLPQLVWEKHLIDLPQDKDFAQKLIGETA